MNKKGFTLAEVLITLGVIGVVSAITMPALIQKHREQVIVTSAKKAYNQFSQAFQMAVTENDTPDNWGFSNYTDVEGNKILFDKLKPYLKIIKECEPENNNECFIDGDSTFNNKNVKKGVLADGTKFYIFGRSSNCNFAGRYCATITAFNNNNTAEYRFWIGKNNILPVGHPNDHADFAIDRCLNVKRVPTPESCTAWMIYNGNMDFLHCPDELSWDGKTKCK